MSISGKKCPTRGLGSMTPERRKEIGSLGGKAVHAQGKAHHWTSATAKIAGRQGGLASARNRQLKKARAA